MKDVRARVYGKLVDQKTKKPVEYATILVLWYNKDSLVGGAISGDDGEFAVENLPPMGGFRFRVKRVGYRDHEKKIYTQIPNKLDQDLGDIAMEVDETLLKEVEVVTEKSTVNLSIDKRSYNVDKDFSVKGGTAVDVMKNVPGLTVDGDGNVQLRNQSPMIFVDGRPTNLTLQQIPADQIERVEVITNPSVKYDASATGGILNIILKKNLKPGYNGMAMAYAGTGDRYGGMLNLNVKEGRWNLTTMYSYNQAINPTEGYTHRTQLGSNGDILGRFDQDNLTRMRGQFNFGRMGLDYALSNRSTISFNNFLVAGRFLTNDDQTFKEDSSNIELASGKRVNDQYAAWESYNTQLQYKKTFPVPGKEVTADVSYNYNQSRNGYLFTTYEPNRPVQYQRNSGTSFANQVTFQSDFVNPISEAKKFESGIKLYYKTSMQPNKTENASGSDNVYVTNDSMSNRYIIDDMVNAVYVNYADKAIWDIAYQAGLRFEQSYYLGDITNKQRQFSYRYPGAGNDLMKSLFPAVYLSRKFGAGKELQLNFSRKIQRPNFFQLMPVVMFADRQNYRIGNPALKPEFRNIAELNFNQTYPKGSFLVSAYGRYEEQPITDVAFPSKDDPDILVNTSINGNNNFRYGGEATLKRTFFKSLDLTLNGNAF
jgi:outer membrane receptor protein involved in Fe transport